MNDSHTCDICGEVRACGLLCACERGETSKATELAALKAEVERMRAERDEARRFGEEAARKHNELIDMAQQVTCAFCGQEYPRGTPRHGDMALAEHIKTCKEHPMRNTELVIAMLRAALVGLVGESNMAELKQMELVILAMPESEVKTGSLAAVRALIATATEADEG